MSSIQKMKTNKLLSILWIFATLNYLYCDVLTLMDSTQLKQILTGIVGNIKMTDGFLLGSGILMEIPIGMVLLSRVLKYRSNRITNIIAGSIMTLVQISSLFVGTGPIKYYVFFSIIEIACTAFIVILSIRWKVSKEKN